MRFCDFPFKYFYLDYFDGRAMLCPWMRNPQGCIGNIFEKSVDELWTNDQANMLRESILNNSFEHCRIEGCPFLQNGNLPEVDDSERTIETQLKPYPTHINLAYDFVCNQYCETCRPDKFRPPKNYHILMRAIRDRIAPYLNTAKSISTSGHGDPFASAYMMDILSNIHPVDPELCILLETNGVYFDEAHWTRIEHLKNVDLRVIVTINSFHEWTYNHISRGGNYKKLMHNLMFLRSLRKDGYIKHFTNTLVIQDRNFREIPEFIDRSFEELECDQVILRPCYQWGTMPADVFWFKDVLNPCHPYHSEYLEIMAQPQLQDKRVFNFAGGTLHPATRFPSADAGA